mmetsp:Transcript_29656/g.43774  ORF Transcript_29656/g.43774 Transcript_29656/m.43774 type:complete len:248 (-) Transcript_29656:219-962(-)
MSSAYPAIVKVILDFCVDPNITVPLHPSIKSKVSLQTYLHRAAHRGDVESMKILLNNHADVNARDQNNRTPLVFACRPFIRKLRIKQFPCSESSSSSRDCHEHPVPLLLSWGADPNNKDKDGMTPLHQACLTAGEVAIRSLIKYGANPKLQSRKEQFCFELAPLTKSNEVLSSLRSALIQAGRLDEYTSVLASVSARNFFSKIVSSFDESCLICNQKLSVCRQNREKRFAYWMCIHGSRQIDRCRWA